MKRSITLSAVFVFAGGFLAPQLHAQCDIAALNGPYGYHAMGVVGGSAFTDLGRFVANGRGKLTSISETITVNGVVSRGQSNTGTYTVNADCTGTLTLRSAANKNLDYDFVFVNGNTELFFTGSDQAAGSYGSARSESPQQCDVTTLNGAYGFHLLALVLNGATASAITESGRFVANAAGALTLTSDVTSVIGGVTRGESIVGTYTVDADCTGTLLLRSATNRSVYYDFVFVNDNSELFLTSSDQPVGLYGSAKKQFLAAPTGGKTFSPAVVPAGGTSTVTITLTNPNPGTSLIGAGFTPPGDTLPAGVVVAAVPNLVNTCGGIVTGATAASTTVQLTGGTIAAGASCMVKFDVTDNNPATTVSSNCVTATSTNGGSDQGPITVASGRCANLTVTNIVPLDATVRIHRSW